MTYSPFLIADMRTGLQLDRKPFMLPQDAFATMENAYLYRGSIRKREGFEVLDYLPIQEATVTGVSTGATTNVTASVITNIANGSRVRIVDTTGVTGINGVVAFAANLSGLSFDIVTEEGVDIATSGTWGGGGVIYSYPDLPITGILSAIDNDNTMETLVFNENTCAKWQASTGYLVPLAATFTGSDSDYFQGYNWRDSAGGSNAQLWFTNNVDPIKVYTPETGLITTPTIDPGGGASAVTRCKFIFSIRQRMVLLKTYEGSAFNSRARWSKIDDSSVWNQVTPGQGGYIDAPTSEHIVTAAQLGDSIIVGFTNSTWVLQYAGDPSLPFIWKKINSTKAIEFPFSSISYDSYILSIGFPGIFACDGSQIQRIDDKVPDLAQDITQDQLKRVYGIRNQRKNQALWSYPSLVSEDGNNDRMIVWNDQDKSWSIYNIAISVMGQVRFDNDLRWDTMIESESGLDYVWVEPGANGEPDTGEMLWVDPLLQDNFPTFVGGRYDGAIVRLDSEALDDGGTAIEMSVTSSELNPFKAEGHKAQLGWVDLYMEADPSSYVDVSFYSDDKYTPYKTQRVYAIPDNFPYQIVTGATAANPCVVSIPDNDFEVGDQLTIWQVNGMVELNGGRYDVTAISGDLVTIDLDASAFSAYASGGIATAETLDEDMVWASARAGAIGYGHSIKFENSDTNSDVVISAIQPWFRPSAKRFHR